MPKSAPPVCSPSNTSLFPIGAAAGRTVLVANDFLLRSSTKVNDEDTVGTLTHRHTHVGCEQVPLFVLYHLNDTESGANGRWDRPRAL